MTDAEYIFQQDIREKKASGCGAFHKKASVRGPKGCKMPSDYLTKKEREAMNGETVTWSMNAFYSWDEFKKMPDYIQVEYINHMCKKYGCGIATLGRGLFDQKINSGLVYNYLKRHGLLKKIHQVSCHASVATVVYNHIVEDRQRASQQVEKFEKRWGKEHGTDDMEEVASVQTIEERIDINEVEFRCFVNEIEKLSSVAKLFGGDAEVVVTIRKSN